MNDIKSMALAELSRLSRDMTTISDRIDHVHRLLELADTPELPGLEDDTDTTRVVADEGRAGIIADYIRE